jgi:D-glycero-D-manno-heptose 1,7-bisphosphate phosphatase
VKPCVFLDRDGTLIEEGSYLRGPDGVVVFPWTIDALRLLARGGYALVIVSNQGGVARGMYDEPAVEAIHASLARRFAAGGVSLDGMYYCPHHPEGIIERYRVRCDCRKPGTGLVRRAVEELGVDPARSFVVGDRWIDVQLADACGARGVLVRTGYGAGEEAAGASARPAAIVDNLIEAAAWILRFAK